MTRDTEWKNTGTSG